MLLEIVKYFRNSLSDIEKLALHPTFSTYLGKYSFFSTKRYKDDFKALVLAK